MAPSLGASSAQEGRRFGYSVKRVTSGAGHDAQCLAAVCPAAMIFVPSIGGISHSPKELSTWEQCGKGAEVLTAMAARLLGLDDRE
jgi:N-carbamoyl-L-amino-acid hydrolase